MYRYWVPSPAVLLYNPSTFRILVPFDPIALLPDHHLLLAFLSLPWRSHIPWNSFLGLLKQNITMHGLSSRAHFLIVLEAQSLGSMCQQVLAPCGGHSCPHFSSSSWWLLPLFTLDATFTRPHLRLCCLALFPVFLSCVTFGSSKSSCNEDLFFSLWCYLVPEPSEDRT